MKIILLSVAIYFSLYARTYQSVKIDTHGSSYENSHDYNSRSSFHIRSFTKSLSDLNTSKENKERLQSK
ncbi:hypothetical protein [Sulfurimonas sp.]